MGEPTRRSKCAQAASGFTRAQGFATLLPIPQPAKRPGRRCVGTRRRTVRVTGQPSVMSAGGRGLMGGCGCRWPLATAHQRDSY